MLKNQLKPNKFQKLQKECSHVLVPCLNCEQLFLLEQVDEHSKTCSKVTNRVQQMGQSKQIFEEINFKIQRLRDSLLQLIGQNRKNEQINSDRKIKHLRRITEIAEILIYLNTGGGKEETQILELQDELKILHQMNDQSIGMTLHIDRLQQLLIQKINIFKSINQRPDDNFLKSRIVSLGFGINDHIGLNARNNISRKTSQQQVFDYQKQNSLILKQNIQELIEQKKNELQTIRTSLYDIQGKVIKEKNLQNIVPQIETIQPREKGERLYTYPEFEYFQQSCSITKNSLKSQKNLSNIFNTSTDKDFQIFNSPTLHNNKLFGSPFLNKDRQMDKPYSSLNKNKMVKKENWEKKNIQDDLKKQIFDRNQSNQFSYLEQFKEKDHKFNFGQYPLFKTQSRSDFFEQQ